MSVSHSLADRLRFGDVEAKRRVFLACAALAVVALTLVIAACGSGSHSAQSSTAGFPNTQAGKQASWLVAAVGHEPVPTAEFPKHFDGAYLATLPAPAAATLNASWIGITGLRLDSITSSSSDSITFVVTVSGTNQLSAALGKQVSVTLSVDSKGLIGGLHLQPTGATPAPLPSAPPVSPTPSASLPASAGSGIRQIAVGVGSPPLYATLTLPAGKGPFPAVVLVGGSGPGDQNESIGPNKPFQDIALGLAARGIASLRYDKRTLDYPQRRPADLHPTQEYVPDALTAIRMLTTAAHRPPPHLRTRPLAGRQLCAAHRQACPPGRRCHHAGRRDRDDRRHHSAPAALPGEPARHGGGDGQGRVAVIARHSRRDRRPRPTQKDPPAKVLLGGAHPVYFLSALAYNEVAAARDIPQPLLFLQGDRDYQVTVMNDLDVWLRGLEGRQGVTFAQFPKDDHLFFSGSGAPTPLEYTEPSHVDPKVIAAMASWIAKVDRRRQ